MLPPGTAVKFVEYLHKYRFAILAFWVVLDILGLIYGLKFLDATTTQFVAPDGSDAVVAENKLINYFPEQNQLRNAVVYVTSVEGESVFDGDLGAQMFEFNRQLFGKVNGTGIFRAYSSYYTSMDKHLPLLAAPFVSDATNTATYISIQYKGTDREESMNFIEKISDDATHLKKQMGLQHRIRVRETGVDYFQADTLKGTEEDMQRMDTMVLPLALFVLACVIQNLPIMFVPLITILTTILVEFLFMYPIALAMDVVAFVPSFMMSLTFAMSIDYSLFLLSRFCEDRRHGTPTLLGIASMLESAGGTIAVSGGTLMICFLGLIFIPMDLISSVGVGSAFVLAVAILANLTLTPVLVIMSEPVVFWLHSYVNFEKLPWVRKEEASYTHHDEADLGGFEQTKLSSPLLLNEESSSAQGGVVTTSDGDHIHPSHMENDNMEEVQKSIWYKLGTAVLSRYTGIAMFCVIIGLTMPVNIYCLDITTTISFDAMVPHSAESFKTYKDFGHTFGQGAVMQYRVLFVNKDGEESLFSESGYTRMQSVIAEMVKELKYTSTEDFIGSVIIDGANISYADTLAAISEPAEDRNSTEQTYVILANTYNSEANEHGIVRASYVLFALETDPYSLDGIDWLVDCRDLFDKLKSKYGLDIYLVYGATVTYDAVEAVYAVFPVVITVTLVVVFVFMSLAFLSIVAPLRLVGTIVLTLTFCYGLAVLVYQYGIFDGMHQKPFNGHGALDWLPPIMCFSVVVGLGLDYDVFLVGRVLEYRLVGYTSDGSILKGLYKTGHIITAAGVIMAVAFSGLFLSDSMILNQVAFFLVVAVLLDTFVIRTVLVPILMGVAGKHAWWPRPNVPDGTKTYGFQEN